jgi:mRNA interferase MazF
MGSTMRRGEVYWVNLDPARGSEIQKRRPCVVVGATPINRARRTVVVVPLSTSAKPRPPLAVPVQCLGRQVVAVCDQIRAVDKSRLLEAAGSLSREDLEAIEEGLRQVLVL